MPLVIVFLKLLAPNDRVNFKFVNALKWILILVTLCGSLLSIDATHSEGLQKSFVAHAANAHHDSTPSPEAPDCDHDCSLGHRCHFGHCEYLPTHSSLSFVIDAVNSSLRGTSSILLQGHQSELLRPPIA